jgi:hypothetical protein
MLDLSLISELCQTIGDEHFFYLPFYKLAKKQDLPRKIWQTLENATRHGASRPPHQAPKSELRSFD